MIPKTWHALRLYVSPVFIRENQLFYSASVFNLVYIGVLIFENHATHWEGHQFILAPDVGIWWWLSMQALLSCIAGHYWRQIRSPLASMTPGMISAEYSAVHYALIIALCLIACPLLLLGAPILNVLAQEAICLALSVNGDMVGPKNLRKPVRTLRMLLMFLLFATFMFPHAQEFIMSAPWYVALGIIICSLIFSLIELHHKPQAVNLSVLDTASNNKKTHTTRQEKQLLNANASSAVSHLLLWQFAWLRKPALPNTMATPGPFGFILGSAILVAGMVVINTVISTLSHMALPTWQSLRIGLLSTPALIGITFTSALCSWMLVRADWPFMLSLAGYGTRRDFAFALFATHGKRAIQLALMCALLCTTLGITFSHVPWSKFPVIAAIIFCVMMASSYLPALALIFLKKGQKAGVLTLNMFGAFVCQQMAVTSVFSGKTLPWWFYALVSVSLPFAALMAWFAPRALAKMDWSIQPPENP